MNSRVELEGERGGVAVTRVLQLNNVHRGVAVTRVLQLNNAHREPINHIRNIC